MSFLDDFSIERLDEENIEPSEVVVAYRLRSPRGAEYLLMRNQHDPWMLFMVGKAIRGYVWFADGDKASGAGTSPLRPVR